MKTYKRKPSPITLGQTALCIGGVFWIVIMLCVMAEKFLAAISFTVILIVMCTATILEMIDSLLDRPPIALHVDTDAVPPVLIKVVGEEEKIYEPEIRPRREKES